MDKISIFAFADEACEMIDGQIVAMKRNGLDGLEIRNVDGTNVSDITLEMAKEVKSKLDANGLVIWSVGSPIGKIDIEKDDFSSHVEKFKHTLEVADALGAGNIRMFSFFMPDGACVDNYKNEVIERLGKLLDISRGSGIRLCHENEKGIYGDTAERCLQLFEALPELCGIFDPANFVQCGEDTKVAWSVLGKYIHYMHIKDALKEGDIVPAGLGDGNIAFVASEYMKKGGRCFTMEPHLAVFSGLSALEKDGKTSEVGKKYSFANNDEAFDAACVAFKKIIER